MGKSKKYDFEFWFLTVNAAIPLLFICGGLFLSSWKKDKITNISDYTPQTRVLFELLNNMPIFCIGYVFGILGGLLRGSLRLQKEPGAIEPKVLILSVTSGGVIGAVATLIMQSNIFRAILLPDNIPLTDVQFSFFGISLVAFFVAFYFSEFAERAKKTLFKDDVASDD
ncbi:MAG: hypothetical protein P1V21_07675 [Rhizobiaceae bacterium]|nr:hypothetical protein [Rhizobiaceae bacterium]